MARETDEQLLVRILSKKIGPVDMDLVIGEVMVKDKHMLTLNGKRTSDTEAEALKREADMFSETKLYKIITETLRYQAQVSMFDHYDENKRTFESGRLLLHAISLLEHTIWACKNPLLLADQKVSSSTPKRRQRPELSTG